MLRRPRTCIDNIRFITTSHRVTWEHPGLHSSLGATSSREKANSIALYSLEYLDPRCRLLIAYVCVRNNLVHAFAKQERTLGEAGEYSSDWMTFHKRKSYIFLS